MTQEDIEFWAGLDDDERLEAYRDALIALSDMAWRYKAVRAQLNAMISDNKPNRATGRKDEICWREKASVGLIETRTVGEHNVRVYADRLAIWRKDGERLTWEELQAVKVAVWGDRVAVEVYPAQRDVLNLRHTRHLWTGPRLTEAVAAECTHDEFANKGT